MTCTELDSTADKAVVVEGEDILLLFQNAVFCMFSTMAEPRWKDGVLPAVVVRVKVEAIDLESLLVSFLNEVLYQHEELGLWPYIVAVMELASESGSDVDLFITADIVFADSMEPYGSQIKAVTYHDIDVEVEGENGHAVANITFDV